MVPWTSHLWLRKLFTADSLIYVWHLSTSDLVCASQRCQNTPKLPQKSSLCLVQRPNTFIAAWTQPCWLMITAWLTLLTLYITYQARSEESSRLSETAGLTNSITKAALCSQALPEALWDRPWPQCQPTRLSLWGWVAASLAAPKTQTMMTSRMLTRPILGSLRSRLALRGLTSLS